MSTVTKLGVYGLAVAAAFAIAFAVLVTAPRSGVEAHYPTTGTGEDLVPVADASVEAFTDAVTADNDEANDVAKFGTVTYRTGLELRGGDTAYLRVFDLGPGDADPDDDHATNPPAGTTSTLFRFSVLDASDADATFKLGGGTSLNCNDNKACDLDKDHDEMTVQLEIAADAPANSSVIVNVQNVNDNTNVRIVLPVAGTALAVSRIELKLCDSVARTEENSFPLGSTGTNCSASSSLSRPAVYDGDVDNTAVQFTWVVWDNRPTPQAYAGVDVFVTTTNSTFSVTSAAEGCRSGSTRCTFKTDDSGGWLQVRGTGVPGPAKLTLEAGGITVTRDLTFYGTAKKITAEADQNSIAVGGTVFIVVTVTDGAGNGISGRNPGIGSGTDSIKGPGTNAVKVTAVDNVAKDVVGTENDAPGCSSGTNAKGKCVIRVTAPNPSGTSSDATRGDHVVTVVGAAPIAAADRKVQVTIAVAGKVNAVDTNAPSRVDPGSTTKITATVVDDEGVRAGGQSVTVTKISGDGVLRNGGPAVTKDGQHTFTYRAASNAGTAEFDVEVRALTSAGAATDSGEVLASTSFTITVGEEAPPEPETPPAPERPTLTPPPFRTGFTASTFSGGSTSDLQDVLLNVYCTNTVSAYATSRGVLVPYIPASRIAAANAAFLGLFSDGTVPAGTNVIVGNCGDR